MVGCQVGASGGSRCHGSTLTVEPDFKSSGLVDDVLLTIGQVAQQAGVATSTVRFYERRGLLTADARRSGQRRYRPQTLRRLVFIGMLQDAGLSLPTTSSACSTRQASPSLEGDRPPAPRGARHRHRPAPTSPGLPRRRPAVPHDHPATDCQIMGQEIERRLARQRTAPT